jgi:predicted Zn-dependent protease with MMP-like domain
MRAPKPLGAYGQLRKIGLAALIALSLGLVVIVVGEGFSTVGAVRVVEDLILGIAAVALLSTAIAFVAVRMAGWHDPESEEEFEKIVRRAEDLGREGLAVDPEEAEFMALDPLNDEDFEELVRDALDELPDLLRNALRHVAVVISDKGRAAGAYGLYQGDQMKDRMLGPPAHDRIVIFRDTLRRDFGHDPELLREQVVRTVRHELAHHVGFDELGVSRLDL